MLTDLIVLSCCIITLFALLCATTRGDIIRALTVHETILREHIRDLRAELDDAYASANHKQALLDLYLVHSETVISEMNELEQWNEALELIITAPKESTP